MRPIALALVLAALSGPALACGPDALGVSRTLRVGTLGGGAVGLKTYPRTLPLAPGEVVLTFDDGPMPGKTERVLAALDAECVKATFFMIGRNAAAAPRLAARVLQEGHTVAYHSMTHPNMRHLGVAAAQANIDKGFQAVDEAVYGDAWNEPRAPFFRFPGFADSPALDSWLASRDIVVFGADLWAGDWEPMTPDQELARLLARLDRSKGGIVLLHDIQPRTVAMLPRFLRALKEKGYRIVHLVPGPGPLETRPAPAGWTSETERILRSSAKGAGG
ncbi:polysaccharide deacetylase family protein [Labrys wisconsinensis]|uniref:Chitooligosaccharide deacetylase n=1 Tax=Labrys wisconsinensis TaxID=425677 RepID=A0ABU0JMC8_9HYPH|nr:polysaccharide deacetylase family protein [Labrys wisconsinensis]MDQ0474419.1 peptidoglycan/xylan/chitin deacetylase (PgdA/CDA1 family) [Labrys wisconsinensis]